jgi:hypothetical protein
MHKKIIKIIGSKIYINLVYTKHKKIYKLMHKRKSICKFVNILYKLFYLKIIYYLPRNVCSVIIILFIIFIYFFIFNSTNKNKQQINFIKITLDILLLLKIYFKLVFYRYNFLFILTKITHIVIKYILK